MNNSSLKFEIVVGILVIALIAFTPSLQELLRNQKSGQTKVRAKTAVKENDNKKLNEIQRRLFGRQNRLDVLGKTSTAVTPVPTAIPRTFKPLDIPQLDDPAASTADALQKDQAQQSIQFQQRQWEQAKDKKNAKAGVLDNYQNLNDWKLSTSFAPGSRH